MDRRPPRRAVALLTTVMALLAWPLSVAPVGAARMELGLPATMPASLEVATVVAPQPAPEAEPSGAAPADLAPDTSVSDNAPAADPCADTRAWVAGAGLSLPDGVGYHCPSTEFAHHGAACWHAGPCPDDAFIAINTDLMAGTSVDYLHHVVAHEICHILDFQATGRSTETGADACAAAHGAAA